MSNLLEDLRKWVLEGNGRRCARIEIGDPYKADHFKVFVYDYDLMVGQHVTSVEEIDLESKYREDLRRVVQKAAQLGLITIGKEEGNGDGLASQTVGSATS